MNLLCVEADLKSYLAKELNVSAAQINVKVTIVLQPANSTLVVNGFEKEPTNEKLPM